MEWQDPHPRDYTGRDIPDGHLCFVSQEGYSRQFGRRAEQVLFGVGTAGDPAGEQDLGSCGDDVPEPAGSGMVPGEHHQGKPVAPHQLHEHECGGIVPSLGSRNGDKMMGLDGLAVFLLHGLDAKGKSCSCKPRDQE